MTVPTIIDSSSRGLARADLAAWHAEGGRLLIHRAAYGTAEDVGLRRAWDRAGAVPGLLRGVYLFWRRSLPVARQLDAWTRLLASLPGPLACVYLDAEGDDLQRRDRPRALADLIAAWTGLRDVIAPLVPGIYTSARWWCDLLGDPAAPELAPAPLWLADYTRRPAPLVPPPWAPPLGETSYYVRWRGKLRATTGWTMRQARGNVRPTSGPLKGCCIDESVWAPDQRPPWEVAPGLPADASCTPGRP